MRALILLFIAALLFCAKEAKSQVYAGTMKIESQGDHYKIALDKTPYNNTYPYPDSASLQVTIVCPTSGTWEVNRIPLNGVLKYKLKGVIYVASSVLWWKNRVRKGTSSMPTICGTYINPVTCFQKI